MTFLPKAVDDSIGTLLDMNVTFAATRLASSCTATEPFSHLIITSYVICYMLMASHAYCNSEFLS